jgi:hypothetical protein
MKAARSPRGRSAKLPGGLCASQNGRTRPTPCCCWDPSSRSAFSGAFFCCTGSALLFPLYCVNPDITIASFCMPRIVRSPVEAPAAAPSDLGAIQFAEPIGLQPIKVHRSNGTYPLIVEAEASHWKLESLRCKIELNGQRKSPLPSGQKAERNRSETRLRGWACRTRTQKCRRKLSH